MFQRYSFNSSRPLLPLFLKSVLYVCVSIAALHSCINLNSVLGSELPIFPFFSSSCLLNFNYTKYSLFIVEKVRNGNKQKEKKTTCNLTTKSKVIMNIRATILMAFAFPLCK